ncbi:hypothetical protein J7I80_05825 [Bacillus sp. ISL-41]|uniref:hypothetical protein n=1 Tax=Bacillus sp. ISL-41 TaxID=2819127 RepID=UPI001BE8EAE4|nr:hypothetical protein [Bacillus sp. ISL-41]MBT2641734.1 hypothetical protein [Bacillus sp. ISL-41]
MCCAGNLKITQEQFEREVLDLVGEEYKNIGEYENTDTPVAMIHHACSHRIQISRSKFLAGNRCRYCYLEHKGEDQRKTTEQYIEELKAISDNAFKVVSEYLGAYHPIKIKHNECGQTFELSAARNMLVHPYCRLCSDGESNGEKLVRKELERRQWHFKTQYRFVDCRDRYPLPFDFAVFSPEEQLQFLIEYDGHGHFQAVEIYGGDEGFEDRKRKDQLKDDYCNDTGDFVIANFLF